jgi:hypothetical protein
MHDFKYIYKREKFLSLEGPQVQDFMTLADGIDLLSRNTGMELPLYAV